MRYFKAVGRIQTWQFMTRDDWHGLWAPRELVGWHCPESDEDAGFTPWRNTQEVTKQHLCRTIARGLVRAYEQDFLSTT